MAQEGMQRINEIVEQIIAQGNQDTTQTETLSEPSRDRESLTKELSLWRESGVPDRHRVFKPDDNIVPEWKEQWEQLRGQLGTGVIGVIIGNRGAGKTQMAVCAIRHECKEQKAARYIKALDFFLDVRSSYRKHSDEAERVIIDKHCEPNLLVIDAIENRSDSQFENMLLNHLIDVRYDRMLDTLLIANYDEKQFATSMGPSIVDRIHECGIKIVCNWKSFRRK